jgi:hypothetical protein
VEDAYQPFEPSSPYHQDCLMDHDFLFGSYDLEVLAESETKYQGLPYVTDVTHILLSKQTGSTFLIFD